MNLLLRYRFWRMRRRARPRREFQRALWAELEAKLPRRSFLHGFLLQRLAVPVTVLIFSVGATATYAYTSPSVSFGHPLFNTIKGRGENIEDRLATTPESSARLRIKKMQRRLSEAEHIADTNPRVAEELVDTARGEFIRGLDQAARIADPKRRKKMFSKLIQGDPVALARIQTIAERHPDQFRAVTVRLMETELERLTERLISIQDEELRSLLERRISDREAMLTNLEFDSVSE